MVWLLSLTNDMIAFLDQWCDCFPWPMVWLLSLANGVIAFLDQWCDCFPWPMVWLLSLANGVIAFLDQWCDCFPGPIVLLLSLTNGVIAFLDQWGLQNWSMVWLLTWWTNGVIAYLHDWPMSCLYFLTYEVTCIPDLIGALLYLLSNGNCIPGQLSVFLSDNLEALLSLQYSNEAHITVRKLNWMFNCKFNFQQTVV